MELKDRVEEEHPELTSLRGQPSLFIFSIKVWQERLQGETFKGWRG